MTALNKYLSQLQLILSAILSINASCTRELRALAQWPRSAAQRAAVGALHPLALIARDNGDVEPGVAEQRGGRGCGRTARAGAHPGRREADHRNLGALAAR